VRIAVLLACIGCRHPNQPVRTETVGLQMPAVHEADGAFPLQGRDGRGHGRAECADCHMTRGRLVFTGLTPQCDAGGQCHDDALHKRSLGARCTVCHRPGEWGATRFDHDQPFPIEARAAVVSFPLTGSHTKPACEACHPDRNFRDTPIACAASACHKRDDKHEGRLGDACERCHTTDQWSVVPKE
jgi:hypothetical protein